MISLVDSEEMIMPIYEYYCNACGHRFEQLQKASDEPLKICPKCQKPDLEKLISNTSFQLKGTGWYVTDFRGKQAKANSEVKAETKPKAKEEKAAKPEAKETKSKVKDEKKA